MCELSLSTEIVLWFKLGKNEVYWYWNFKPFSIDMDALRAIFFGENYNAYFPDKTAPRKKNLTFFQKNLHLKNFLYFCVRKRNRKNGGYRGQISMQKCWKWCRKHWKMDAENDKKEVAESRKVIKFKGKTTKKRS